MFEVKQQTSNNKLSSAISQSSSKKNKGTQRPRYIPVGIRTSSTKLFMAISQGFATSVQFRKDLFVIESFHKNQNIVL